MLDANRIKSQFISLLDGLQQGDPFSIGIVVALVVILISTVIFAFKGRSNKRRGVLLLGLCDSGKTLIFYRLVHGKYTNTHTSIRENVGTFKVKGDQGKNLRIMDLPGHDRLKAQFMEQYKNSARALVYMVDSCTVGKDIQDVAENLYNTLTDKTVQQNLPPVLVLCNKQDQTMAKGAKLVQALLEKEINTLRVTKSAMLESITNTANNNTYLGKKGKDFQFSDLKPMKVEFAEVSARGDKDGNNEDLKELNEWLLKIA